MIIEGKQYIKAGTVEALRSKRMLHIRIMGKPVSVFIAEDGVPFAVEMSCKHQGASLATGVISGPEVTCSRHGWKYNLHTGLCLNANSPSLRRHPLHIEEEFIYVAFYPEER